MRRTLLALCCVGSAGSLLLGQQPAPSFKGGVTLVTIDVTVLDGEGRPVPGLTAADFQVKLNGRVQPVRALSYLEARSGAPDSPPKSPGPVMPQMFPIAPVADEPAASVTEPRVFVILVDDLSFPPLGGKALFLAAQRFIAELPPGDLVGFATSSGPGAVNPTTDRARVNAALTTVVGEYTDPRAIDRGGPSGAKDLLNGGPDQSVGISQALDIDRGDTTALKDAISRECFNGDRTVFNRQSLEQLLIASKCASDLQSQARRTAALTRQTTARQVGALQSVIGAMKPAVGVKHLLLLTEGVGVTFDASTLTPVVRAAAEAGVQLSVMVDEPGVSMTDTGRRDPGGVPQQADTGMSERRREDNAMFVTGAHTLADMVGGAFYRVIGAPDPSFRRVAIATSGIYRLAVEPPGDAAPGRDFALVATVRRPGLTVQANKRAIANARAAGTPSTSVAPTPPKPAGTVDDRLRAAMNSGRAVDGLPIAITSRIRRAVDPAQVEIGVRVEIPAAAPGPLTAVFGLVDNAGKLRSGRRPIETPPDDRSYRVAFSVTVTPGPYRLRFAVADASGRVSAVDTAVRAELSALGPFAAGDLEMSWTDASGKESPPQFPADDLPAAAATLVASLDLHLMAPAAAPGDVMVKVTFGVPGQPGIERIVAPANDNGTLRAEAAFPLERIAAGVYAIEAAVMVDGKVVGTRSATIAKR